MVIDSQFQIFINFMKTLDVSDKSLFIPLSVHISFTASNLVIISKIFLISYPILCAKYCTTSTTAWNQDYWNFNSQSFELCRPVLLARTGGYRTSSTGSCRNSEMTTNRVDSSKQIIKLSLLLKYLHKKLR